MADWKGRRSCSRNSLRDLSTLGISLWVSPWVSPCPGKCLPLPQMPPWCRPRTAAAACNATLAGLSPKERLSMMGELGLKFTSQQGPRMQLKPARRISSAMVLYMASVPCPVSATPRARLPGPVVDSPTSTPQAPS
ncbi:hypothetical protein D3C75_606720 [compost metagenome]